MKDNECGTLLRSIGNFAKPLLYLFSWYLFLILITKNVPSLCFSSDTVLLFSFLIFVLGLITKSSFWSVGHDKFGMKGDSRSRLINFHKEESGGFWFDLFADNPDLLKDEEIRGFVEKLTQNKEQGP